MRLIFNFRSRGIAESAIFYQVFELHWQNWVAFSFLFLSYQTGGRGRSWEIFFFIARDPRSLLSSKTLPLFIQLSRISTAKRFNLLLSFKKLAKRFLPPNVSYIFVSLIQRQLNLLQLKKKY